MTKVQVTIKGSKQNIWHAITDIENATNRISGIEKIEILNKPDDGLLGLKWKETRTLFGKTATEVMWITDVNQGTSYRTRAESHGAVYITKLEIVEQGSESLLTMKFNSEAQTFVGKIMALIFGVFFKGSMRKMLLQDLNDIKAEVERL